MNVDDLGVLRWFVETARCKSFTVTAEKYGISPSAVSQGIARLERELGARLFNRTTRQQNLTTEGQAFLEKVEDGLATLEEAVTLISDAKDEPSGLIRISVPSSYGKDGLLPVLAEFLRMYPKVDLDVCFHDGAVDLIKQGLDLALVRRGQQSAHSVTRRLGRNGMVLAASPAYLERHGVPSKPMDLSGHEWITVRYPSGTFDFELEWIGNDLTLPQTSEPDGLRRYKIEYTTSQNAGERHHVVGGGDSLIRLPRSRITISEQIVMAVDAALLGMGIAILTINLAQRYFQSGELKLLLPEYRAICDNEMFVEYPHKSYLPSKTRKLIDYVIERFPTEFAPSYDPESLLQFAAKPVLENRSGVISTEHRFKSKRK